MVMEEEEVQKGVVCLEWGGDVTGSFSGQFWGRKSLQGCGGRSVGRHCSSAHGLPLSFRFISCLVEEGAPGQRWLSASECTAAANPWDDFPKAV